MNEPPKSPDTLVWFLSERAKELSCLYKIEGLLNKPDANLADICRGVIEAIPPGWQYPDICVAKITIEGFSCQSTHFKETPWVQFADIRVQDKKVGRLSIYYLAEMPHADDGPFLKEETKLLGTIVERLGSLHPVHPDEAGLSGISRRPGRTPRPTGPRSGASP